MDSMIRTLRILFALLLALPCLAPPSGGTATAARHAARTAPFTTGLTSYLHVAASDGDSPVMIRVSFADPATIRLQVGAGFAPPEVRPALPFRVASRPDAVEIVRGGLACRILSSPLRILLATETRSVSFLTPDTTPGVILLRDTPGGAARIRFEIGEDGGRLLGEFGATVDPASTGDTGLLFFDRELRRVAAIPPPSFISTAAWGLTLPRSPATVLRRSSPRSLTILDSTAELLIHLPSNGSIAEALRIRRPYLSEAAPPDPVAFRPWITVDSYTPPSVIDDIRGKLRFLGLPVAVAALEEWSRPPVLAFRAREIPAVRNGSSAVFRLPYTGSNLGQFEGMRAALGSGFSAGLGGFAVTAMDIGSYLNQRAHGPAPLSPEAWIRWIQLAAFSPVMQVHMRHESHAPWHGPNPAVADRYRDYAWMHVNLEPYLVSESRRSARDGFPLIAPLVLVDSGPRESLAADEAYLLGRDLLVAPVLEPYARERMVSLPPGRWIDYWTDLAETGGRSVVREAPLDLIPVYARGGSVIPLRLDTACQPGSPPTGGICLRLFPDAGGKAVAEIEDARGRKLVVSAGIDSAAGRIRLRGLREPVRIWIPWNGAPPRHVSLGARRLARGDHPPSRPGWFHDAESGRLIVFVDARGNGEVKWR